MNTEQNTNIETSKSYYIVLDEQHYVSGKISDMCRYIGFAISGACYGLFISNSALAETLVSYYLHWLVTAAFFAILTVVSDYLQLLFGYFSVQQALINNSEDYKYNEEYWAYKGRQGMFIIKQLTTVVAFGTFIYPLLCLYGIDI